MYTITPLLILIPASQNTRIRYLFIFFQHDAKTTLGENHQSRLTMHSINLHYKCMRIASDLVMVGLGGSLPGYQGSDPVWVGMYKQKK